MQGPIAHVHMTPPAVIASLASTDQTSRGESGNIMLNLQSALGVVAIIAFAWAVSENRRAVSPRRIVVGIAVALVRTLLFLKVPPVPRAFPSLNVAIDAAANASRAGTS